MFFYQNDHQGLCLAQNTNKELKRSAYTCIFVKMCFSRSRAIHMNDSDFFRCHQTEKMSIRKLLRKNVRFKHFCQKMRALEKWCATKVAHCKINVMTSSVAVCMNRKRRALAQLLYLNMFEGFYLLCCLRRSVRGLPGRKFK